MSIHEVRIGKEPIEAITFSQLEKKKKESKELADQIAEWESKHGKVPVYDSSNRKHDYVPINEFTGEPDFDRSVKVAAHNEKQKSKKKDKTQLSDGISFYSGKSRSKERSKLGQNIKRHSKGIVVEILGNKSGIFPDTKEGLKEAREHRDKKRAAYGMLPAEY